MVLDESIEVLKLVIEGTVEVKNEAATDITLTATYIHIYRGQFLCGCKTTNFLGKFSIILAGDVTTDALKVENGPSAGSKVISNSSCFDYKFINNCFAFLKWNS